MKRTIPVIGIILILLTSGMTFTSIGQKEGKIITVNDDGGDVDCSSIQIAILCANDGDTIWVYSGNYEEELIIGNKKISIIGKPYEPYDPSTIKGNPIIQYWHWNPVTNLIYINDAEVVITNFSLTGSTRVGVRIHNSKNIKLSNISIERIDTGIEITNSSQCILSSNFFNSYGGMDGIIINQSSDITVSHNTFDDLFRLGLILEQSYDCTIENNIFINDSIDIFGQSVDQWSSHTIINNTMNGKPIRYYKNCKNITVANNTSQVIFANCTNSVIQNLHITNGDKAIILGHSSDNIIKNNVLENVDFETISLVHSSNNNTIQDNVLDDCRKKGVSIKKSQNNLIKDNQISDCSDGIFATANSDNTTIINNNLRSNYNGIKIFHSSDCYIIDNTIKSSLYGIYLWGSCGTIHNNYLGGGDRGVVISSGPKYVIVTNNTFRYNDWDGLQIIGFDGAIIQNNTFTNIGDISIYLIGADGSYVSNNSVIKSGHYGIYLHGINYTVIDNVIDSCDFNGIKTKDSDNVFRNNVIRYNKRSGIYIEKGDNNTIEHNVIEHNDIDGIQLSGSYHTINNNTITDNKRNGIFFSGSNNVQNNSIISHNTILNNHENGIFLNNSTAGNEIWFNSFINNSINAVDEGLNIWYSKSNEKGNFWDDYTGTDQDGNGLGDSPYNISGGDNQDLFPLMKSPYYTDLNTIINDGYGMVVDISNVGNIVAKDVKMNLRVTGGIFGLINTDLNDNRIGDIPVGGTYSLKFNRTHDEWMQGIGSIVVNISVSGLNVDNLILKESGFIFGPFVIIRSDDSVIKNTLILAI